MLDLHKYKVTNNSDRPIQCPFAPKLRYPIGEITEYLTEAEVYLLLRLGLKVSLIPDDDSIK